MKIIPFGKYKGQPIEVMINDSDYTKWILAQESLLQKYPELKTLIINNFKEPSETPEHNKLQTKFLSDDFCIRLLQYITPNLFSSPAKINDSNWSFRMADKIKNISLTRRFEEKGIDVLLKYSIYYNETFDHFDDGSRMHLGADTYQPPHLKVEIKPIVGDDYPAVLRQMKGTSSNILYIDQYQGTGASLEQFTSYFNNEGIHVVFDGSLD